MLTIGYHYYVTKNVLSKDSYPTCTNPKKWKSSELGMSTLENFKRWQDLEQIFFTKSEFHFVILMIKSKKNSPS